MAATDTGDTLVRELIERQRDREARLDTLSYDIDERREELAKDGTPRRVRTRRFEVFHVAGRPLRRLVSEDGLPLSASRQAREDARIRELSRAIREGRAVTERPGVRLSALLEHYELRALDDVPGPFGPARAFEIVARPRGTGTPPPWLRDLAGRLLIDADERELIRLELRNTRGLRFALGVGASVAALAFELENTRLADGLWLPRRLVTRARGRRFPFRHFDVRTSVTWSGFRRFEVTTEEAVQPPAE